MQRGFTDRELKYQNKNYRPCRSFMLRGGIYGRSTVYPWRALRPRRIFRRVIRLDLTRCEVPWRQRSPNATAFNVSEMVPVFAYQWRPKRVVRRMPDPSKTQPIRKSDEPVIMKRAA